MKILVVSCSYNLWNLVGKKNDYQLQSLQPYQWKIQHRFLGNAVGKNTTTMTA